MYLIIRNLNLIYLVGLLIPFGLPAQNHADQLVLKLDAYIDSIDNQQDLSKFHQDGLMTVKWLLFFKKRIGSFYTNTTYSDEEILSIENQYHYNKKTEVHYKKYYFRNHSLIAFFESIRDRNGLKYQVSAYFNDNTIIKAIVETDINNLHFDDLKATQVLIKAIEELEYWQKALWE